MEVYAFINPKDSKRLVPLMTNGYIFLRLPSLFNNSSIEFIKLQK